MPPPPSSAGVPMTLTVSPTSSATRAAASPAPTAIAAIMLWPQAWPMPGRLSYSAQIAMCSGPEPARATKAVGRSHTPRFTSKPAADEALREPEGGALLLEADLGMGVNAMAQRQQIALGAIQALARPGLGVHGTPLAQRPRG